MVENNKNPPKKSKEFLEGVLDGMSTIGRVAERAAFIGALATGIGAIQYIRGRWPFTKVKRRIYVPTQWVTDHKGPVLEGPGRGWFLSPLIKRIRVDGKTVEINAEIQDHDCGEFQFRTRDGMEGKLNAQYLYRVNGREGASRFYWEYGADPSRFDVIVERALTSAIGNIDGINVMRKSEVSEGGMSGLLDDAEKQANDEIAEQRGGIRITNIAISKLDFDEASQRILSQNAEAIERGKSIMRISEAEAYRTLRQAQATSESAQKYLDAAQTYSEQGSRMQAGDIALLLQGRDTDQEIANSGVKALFTRRS